MVAVVAVKGIETLKDVQSKRSPLFTLPGSSGNQLTDTNTT